MLDPRAPRLVNTRWPVAAVLWLGSCGWDPAAGILWLGVLWLAPHVFVILLVQRLSSNLSVWFYSVPFLHSAYMVNVQM